MSKPAGRYRLRICIPLALLIGAAAVVVPTPVVATERTMRVETVVPSAIEGVTGLASRLPQFFQSDLSPFQMIGASWTGAQTAQARVRVRNGAKWGPWTSLEADEDDGPDPGSPEDRASRVVTRPLWIAAADGYELQAPSQDLKVHLVREGGRRVRVQGGTKAGSATGPAIADRGAWGARAPRRPSGVAPSLKMAFVHHTTGLNNYNPGDVPRMIRSIQAYHMYANGWDDIGYNFLVDRFGRMWEGRAGSRHRAVIGAHTRGFNTSSTGVAVLGNYTRASPSPAAVDSVARVAGWMLGSNRVDPGGHATMTSAGSDKYRAGRSVRLPAISGHRDGTSTTCPGRLYDRLPEIRARARGYVPPTSLLDPLLRPLLPSASAPLPPPVGDIVAPILP